MEEEKYYAWLKILKNIDFLSLEDFAKDFFFQ